MTALAAPKLINRRPVTKIMMPVKGAVVCYSGALAFNDAGNVRGGVPTAITPVLGYFDNTYDNSLGANGAVSAAITVDREGIALLNGAGGDALANANVGQKVYAIDDQTVGLTSGGGTRPIVGTMIRLDDQGMVWVALEVAQHPVAVLALQAGLKVAYGTQVLTVTAADTIATGLAKVVAAFAQLDDAPVIGCDRAQASLGNQAGAPVAGSIVVETFAPTSNANPTPVAATTFGKKVNWIAFGW